MVDRRVELQSDKFTRKRCQVGCVCVCVFTLLKALLELHFITVQQKLTERCKSSLIKKKCFKELHFKPVLTRKLILLFSVKDIARGLRSLKHGWVGAGR